MIPDYVLDQMRENFGEFLSEMVAIKRPVDETNFLGVPNSDEYEQVPGLESVSCRFISGESGSISAGLIDDETELNVDTLRVSFAYNVPVQIDDLIVRGELQYRVIGVFDNASDLVGNVASVKRIREDRS